MTIISNTDVEKVMTRIVEGGYSATKISTTGQFLKDGHTAVLIVCDEDRVDNLVKIIKANVSKRIVRTPGVMSTVDGSLLNQSVDVEEYGGIAFIINVEDFQKF